MIMSTEIYLFRVQASLFKETSFQAPQHSLRAANHPGVVEAQVAALARPSCIDQSRCKHSSAERDS